MVEIGKVLFSTGIIQYAPTQQVRLNHLLPMLKFPMVLRYVLNFFCDQ